MSGCLVDPDQRCDANQVELEADFGGCVCAPGSVLNAEKNGCQACGANEVVSGGACTCDVGFAKLTPEGPCSPSLLGAACDTARPCGGEFPVCVAEGYCTSTCSTATDCTGGYACDASASPAYCRRPPSGQGTPCTTSADCANFDAKYCAQGACLISDCATTNRCHGSWVCCDFTALGAEDICVDPAMLMAGMCPYTNAPPVMR